MKNIIQNILNTLTPNRMKVLTRKCKKKISPNCITDVFYKRGKVCVFCNKEVPKANVSPLKEVRLVMGITTKEMAKLLNIAEPTYKSYEAREKLSKDKPMLQTKNRIVKVLEDWMTLNVEDQFLKDKLNKLKQDVFNS